MSLEIVTLVTSVSLAAFKNPASPRHFEPDEPVQARRVGFDGGRPAASFARPRSRDSADAAHDGRQSPSLPRVGAHGLGEGWDRRLEAVE